MKSRQKIIWIPIILLLLLTGCAATPAPPPPPATENLTPPPASPRPPTATAAPAAIPAWIWNARIATAPAADWEEWTAQVDAAVANGATVILGWDRFQGAEWQTLYEPALSAALAETQQRAQWIHQHHPGVHYIIYMAPLEATIAGVDNDEDGQVDPDQADRSLATQHPDWAQTGLDGRQAVFYGSLPEMPFWVCPTCEDVWLTPANAEFRALVLNQFQRLAAETELDGVWHDVPFLMGGYFGEGWPEGQFPDVGPEARALFTAETGYSLPDPPLTADWNDPAWQHFVRWRYALINGYLADIRDTVAQANPDFAFIPETSVGFDAMLTQLAASPVDLPTYSHTTAHELGGTERPVQYYAWLRFLATLQAWRHLDLAHGEPSWLLSYVEAGHADTRDLARLHAAAAELSGFRTLTSGDEGMTAAVDEAFYRDLYTWLAQNRPLADPDLRPAANVAVLFSQQTLDFVGRGDWETDYAADFAGALMVLLESHIPFEVIADDDLARLDEFQAAILPGAESLSDAQAEQIRAYVQGGGRLLATGYTSSRDEYGNERDELALADVFGTTLAEIEDDESIVHENAYGDGYALLSPEPHELWYYWEADPEGEDANPTAAEAERAAFLDLLGRLHVDPGLQTDAPRQVILLPYRTATGATQVGVINLVGVDAANVVPTPQTFTLTLPSGPGLHRARESAVPVAWAEILETPTTLTPEIQGETVTVSLGVRVGGLLRMEDTAIANPAVYLPLLRRAVAARPMP